MLLLGGAVLFLTMALIEANPFAGDLPLWLSLMQGAILLGVLFFWWERRAPDPMITPGLLANRQFRNANIGMLFFAAGAIGSLLLLSLMFVNLWGYTQLEAGAGDPAGAADGAPRRGRSWAARPTRRAPGELAKPALICMAVGMLIVSFLPATADNAWTYIRVLPGLLLIGVGMGIGFPALNVGAMGAVTGQDLGLASGVLNTARQLGAAIGRLNPDRHLRRRAPRPHVLVRERQHRRHRRRLRHAEADGRPGDRRRPCTTTRAEPRTASSRSRASTRTSSARRPARPARASPGRSARPPCWCCRRCR